MIFCHIRGLWPKSSYSTDVFSQRKPGEPAADGAHKHSWPYQFVYAVLNSRSKTKLLVVTEQFLRFPLPLLTLELLLLVLGRVFHAGRLTWNLGILGGSSHLVSS